MLIGEKMNILKPQKIQVEKLQKIDYLDYELRDNDEELEYRILENIKLNNEEMYDAKIGKSKFQNVEILNEKLENNTFIDVIFDNCNFSNSSFENSAFIRCEFNNCKLIGCNFAEARIYNVTFNETNANYINLSMSSIENVCFDKTVLRNANFQENKLKNVYFQNSTDLTQAQIFKTSFKNIDLSEAIIEGIAISQEDIKGAIIDASQAIDLLYLLGVKIKN